MVRCGIDMIENQRVADGVARFGDQFLDRVFTPGERADCKDHPMRLAARWAAKEAVAKALGTGVGPLGWRSIEIRVDNPSGRPVLILHGEAVRVAAELGLTQWDVSLTHTADYAAAMVVAL